MTMGGGSEWWDVGVMEAHQSVPAPSAGSMDHSLWSQVQSVRPVDVDSSSIRKIKQW